VDELVTAVAGVRDRLVASLNPANVAPEALAYLQDDERLAEAKEVSPCVLRFITAEIDPPTNGKPVGRFAGVTVAPPVGTYLRKAQDRESVIVPVRALVARALAHGYFSMVESEAMGAAGQGPEINVVPGRAAEEIWPFWTTNMSTGDLLRTAAHAKAIDQVTGVGGRQFSNGLQELGLGGWRRGRRPFTGMYYTEAGMLLRMLQTDRFEPGPRANILTATNAWPFEAMPVE
jgi:hypothetical protein